MKTLPTTIVTLATIALFGLTGCNGEKEPQQEPQEEERAQLPASEERAAAGGGELEPYACGSIARLHVYDGVFLGSQPAPEDFEEAKKNGVVTVINLRHPDEIEGFDEEQVVGDLGLAYHNPAWNGPEEFTDAVVDRVRELLRSKQRPILLHCSSGNRVGAMWMAHRALDGGLDVDAALAEAITIGMKSPAYEEKTREYIARMRKEPG